MAFGTMLLLLQLAGPAAASAQRDAEAKALRDARDAQERFERVRRWNLPRRPSGPPDRCDVIVGRFCHWHDSTDADLPTEHPRIGAARTELHAELDDAARAAPATDWIAGQRVRYFIEAARWTDAIGAARACAGEPWWCFALEGLAHHAAQHYGPADSAFARALDAMGEERRCAWTDLRSLTSGAVAKELARAACPERAAMARALWRLARPLWSVPGNDAATEHFARHTMARIQDDAETASDLRFGDDNRELLIRYGWHEWFTRDDPPVYQVSPPAVTAHSREPSYNFFPELRTVRGDARVERDDWQLRNPASVTRYAPRHVEWMGELGHQLARFPRGDSTLLAVAARVRDTAMAGDSLVMSLVTLVDGRTRTVAAGDGPELLATIVRDTMVVSLEAVGQRSKRSERARYTVDPLPCTRWCLSDLLLFTARDTARDVALERVAELAIADSIADGGRLGIYWELQGVAHVPVDVTLAIEPIRVSRLRRAAARLKLASTPSAVRLKWTVVPDSALSGHSVAVPIPRGHFRVVLEAEPRGQRPQGATREVSR